MFGNETKVSVPVAPTPFRMLPTIGTGPDPWQCPKGRGLTAFVLEATNPPVRQRLQSIESSFRLIVSASRSS